MPYSYYRRGLPELEPYCETVFAAVLFADISGFTRLSARLSEEELKYHIKYEQMLIFYDHIRLIQSAQSIFLDIAGSGSTESRRHD